MAKNLTKFTFTYQGEQYSFDISNRLIKVDTQGKYVVGGKFTEDITTYLHPNDCFIEFDSSVALDGETNFQFQQITLTESNKVLQIARSSTNKTYSRIFTIGSEETANWKLETEFPTFKGRVNIDNSTLGYNTSIGEDALTPTSTIFVNTAIGTQALEALKTGNGNISIGVTAMRNSDNVNDNVAIGNDAFRSISNSDKNVGIGKSAGEYNQSGVRNTKLTKATIVGAFAKTKENDTTNEIVIGAEAIGKGSNTAVIGNDSITDTYLKGKVHIPSLPDGYLENVGTNYLLVSGKGSITENGIELLAAKKLAKTLPIYLGDLDNNSVITGYKGQTFYNTSDEIYYKINVSFSEDENIAYYLSEGYLSEISETLAKEANSTILVAPGKYEVTGGLTLDTPYINLMSLTGYTDVEINGINLTVDNVSIKGINCKNSVFKIADNLPNIIIENCISNGVGSFCVSATSSTNSSNTISGTFINCKSSASRCFGAYEITSGIFIRCIATSSTSHAFSRNNVAAGIYIDCEAGGSCFGGSNDSGGFLFGKATGYFERCKVNGDGHPFGINKASGIFKYCEVERMSGFQPLQASYVVGSTINKCTGTFINCISGPGSFGGCYDSDGFGIFDGYAINCIGGLGSFGSNVIGGGVAGTIVNCSIRNMLSERNGWVDENTNPEFKNLTSTDCTINGDTITCLSNELGYGRKIKFESTNLPVELNDTDYYYVTKYDYLTNTFKVAATHNGVDIVTSATNAACKLKKGAILNCVDGTNTLINKTI